eukprot:364466-Chlamydomonas_euryale.AAC.2
MDFQWCNGEGDAASWTMLSASDDADDEDISGGSLQVRKGLRGRDGGLGTGSGGRGRRRGRGEAERRKQRMKNEQVVAFCCKGVVKRKCGCLRESVGQWGGMLCQHLGAVRRCRDVCSSMRS